jgi:hypothetical protein
MHIHRLLEAFKLVRLPEDTGWCLPRASSRTSLVFFPKHATDIDTYKRTHTYPYEYTHATLLYEHLRENFISLKHIFLFLLQKACAGFDERECTRYPPQQVNELASYPSTQIL